MTLDNLQIIITNAKCCIATLGAKVSDLYSIGSKCADTELVKLKILEDRVNLLEDYYCNNTVILSERFNEGVFPNAPTGWEYSLPQCWFWNAKKITPSGNTVDLTSGAAGFSNVDNEGLLYKTNLLTIDKFYKVEFDLYFQSDIDPDEEPSRLQIGLGTNFLTVPAKTTVSHIVIEGFCEENSTFTIKGVDITPYNAEYLVDNIVITEFDNTCLTYEQIDSIAHKVMKQCDICDCQLSLNEDSIVKIEEFIPY